MADRQGVYNEGSRFWQDRFDTRRLADRIKERLVDDVIDDDDREMIQRLDMFFLATADEHGQPQCSYKGGEPGFVRVVDEHTIAFPNFDGNGMYLSMGNALRNPHVGLLFIDFERQKRLRLNGVASIDEAGSAARRLSRGAVHRPRAGDERSSRTARATSTSCSWSSGPASCRRRRVRRPCRNGSVANGPATCLPPAIRRATPHLSRDRDHRPGHRRGAGSVAPTRAGDGGREAPRGCGRRPRRCCRDAARRGACPPGPT